MTNVTLFLADNMATVFNAWDTDLEREVAIKMLKYKLAYDPKFLDQFEQEAKIIASLNHHSTPTSTQSTALSTAALSLQKMQVSQKAPDIRNTCFEIDDELAQLIESALSKEPAERISDWEEIKDILKPVSIQHILPLDPHELAVVIRFRDTSDQQSASFINTAQKILQQDNINHLIEIHRGDDE